MGRYLKNFDPAAWGDRDPIRTVVAGRVYTGGEVQLQGGKTQGV